MLHSAFSIMLQQILLIRVRLVAEVATTRDSRVSCDMCRFSSDNFWRVGRYRLATNNRWGDESVGADWDISGCHSEAVDVVSNVICALYDAIPIHVGISATGHAVQGLGFDFGRRTSGVAVTVLAESVLCVVLMTGGCDYGARRRRYLHTQQRNLRESRFWDEALCGSRKNKRFGGNCHLHLQDKTIRELRNASAVG
jgi:hypothetical protein